MAVLGWDSSAVGPAGSAGIAEPETVLAADDAAGNSDSSANVAV
jgi:hypothetical protein